MKFRFETILKLRKNKENLAQKTVAMINSHFLKQQEYLQFMETVETKSMQDLNNRMEQGTSVPVMMLYDNFFTGVRSQEKRQNKVISEVNRHLETKRAELADAMAKRRIMEILRERDFLALTTAQKKRETEQMDEIGANQWRLKST